MNERQKLEKAVDEFAEAMKKRLLQKYDDGYSGWDDPEDCQEDDLILRMVGKAINIRQLKLVRVKKSVVDVANFAMMLFRRFP